MIAKIETDKATMELESYKNGTLLYIGVKPGEKIAVNELLCIIGEKGKVDVDAIVAKATENETTEISLQENGRIKASPLAKRLAAEKGIDLRKVHGSGDGGRITKE